MASKVPGVHDHELRPELHEAHRVLSAGLDAFQKAIDQVEGQFLRPLANAHDGESPACLQVKAQLAAFRRLYLQPDPVSQRVEKPADADVFDDTVPVDVDVIKPFDKPKRSKQK